MDKRQENRKILWDSLEMNVVRRELIMMAVLWAVLGGIFAATAQSTNDWQTGTVLQVVIGAVILPFVGFYLWRTIQIFRKADQYLFCRCKLASPHQRYWARGMMYFTVIVEDEQLGGFPVETHAIFASYGFLEPLLETYINSTVTIGYNLETEMVVIIG